MNIIVDEKETVKLSKEEKLLLALNDCNNKKLLKRAQILYKLELYSKEEVTDFDENLYIEVSPKTIKGYSLLKNEEGELFLVKELKADNEADSYGYSVLSLANPTDDELKQLMECNKPVCVGKIVLLCVFTFFLFLALLGFVTTYLDGLESAKNAIDALTTPFLCYGTSVVLGFGLLLLFFKGNKKCCKK